MEAAACRSRAGELTHESVTGSRWGAGRKGRTASDWQSGGHRLGSAPTEVPPERRGAEQTVGGSLILASCMCTAPSAAVGAASITHRQIELNGNIVVSLTAVTSHQLTADLLGLVTEHIIRGSSAGVRQPSAGPVRGQGQALPKVKPGLPAGSATSFNVPSDD